MEYWSGDWRFLDDQSTFLRGVRSRCFLARGCGARRPEGVLVGGCYLSFGLHLPRRLLT